jgi:hypothetical protein
VKNQHPAFFFTASFLRGFAEHYYRQIKLAQEDPNLDAFKHFLYNSSGSILIDEELDIEPFPLLKRIYQTDGAQYKIYKLDPSLGETEREINAFDNFSASFSQQFNKQKIEALESQKQRPIFNLEKVSKRWANISGQKMSSITEGLPFDWLNFLAPIVVPTKQILICDSFLTTNTAKLKNNLFPVLRAFQSLIKFKGQITLISTHENIGRLQDHLKEEFSDQLEFKLAIVESTAIKTQHDRRLVTDSFLLNIPSGFDVINNQGLVTDGKGTEPISKSIFSGDEEQLKTHARLRTTLYSLADRILSRRVVTN